MIEPLLWAVISAAAVAVCWAKIRSGSFFWAACFFVLALIFAKSGWDAFEALLAAMEATSAGVGVEPFRVTLIVAAPMVGVLAWPFVQDILRGLAQLGKGHTARGKHGSA
jgi:hypothetical protein